MEKGLVFGLNIGELLEIYDHDSQSWKMSGCLFTGDYAKSSVALPRSGIMLNGKIYEQRTLARRTGGKESGSWPTPGTGGIGCGTGSEQTIFNKVKDGTITEQEAKRMLGRINRPKIWPRNKEKYPTITANDAKNSITESQRGRGTLTAAMLDEKQRSIPDGQLNPQWVDWLMGYPEDWTDLEVSEMRLSLK